MTAVNWDISTDAISQAQADFLDDETNLYPAYVAGYGAGKTYAGCYKALDHSVVHGAGCLGLFVGLTYPHIRDIFWPTLFDKILDPAGIPYDFNKGDRIVRFRWGGGISFKSAEKPQRIVGSEYAFGYVDEPQLMPQLVWKNMLSRMRTNTNHIRQVFATFTPEIPGWTHDLWGVGELTGDELPKGYVCYQGRTADNWTLGDQYEQNLLSEWDENEAQARVYGSFAAPVSGRVYHAFTRENVNAELAAYNPKRTLWASFDFNERPGMHVTLCQRDEQAGLFLVVGEIFRKGLKLEDVCDMILERYGELQ